ncbi:hypothetical protein TNCV_3278041 [Trichonephila clavipes]|nr:hypothetical protein TNCV_3278041 [Trichonephila clavipes]
MLNLSHQPQQEFGRALAGVFKSSMGQLCRPPTYRSVGISSVEVTNFRLCPQARSPFISRKVAHSTKSLRPRTSELYDLFIITSDISDISDFMDFSPTRQSKVAACEKLRDTVHSISAMHSSISEGVRTPTKKNSFLELYQMTSYDLAKKKTKVVSELKPLPHVQEMIAKSIKFPDC